jgi:hypothetical protein
MPEGERKMIQSKVAFCILMVVALMSMSQICESSTSDFVGLFFDTLATDNCCTGCVGTPIGCHLLLINPSTVAGIAGWQGTLHTDSVIQVLGGVFFGENAINLGLGNDYLVGLSQPIPGADIVQLATFFFLAFEPGGACFDFLSTDNLIKPAYLSGDGQIIPMTLLYGGFGSPSVTLGDIPCPESSGEGQSVSTRRNTWGEVKSLYR